MAGTISQRVYDLVSNYTSESLIIINPADIQAAAQTLQDSMISAHDEGDINISGNYTYYDDISSVSNTDLGIDAIKEANIIAKIKSANTVFNFKNTVDNKYIMVYDQKAFVFDTESDFDNTMTSFNWSTGSEVYTGGANNTVTQQYNNSLSPWMTNSEEHQ
tara:strand:- start:4808 stop:5290 length:483 start_codon:yes stop_codon:yes gene_type:complete